MLAAAHLGSSSGLRAAHLQTLPCDLAAVLLLSAEFAELRLPSECTISFPEGATNQLHFEITICPTENLYRYAVRERQQARSILRAQTRSASSL